MVLNSKYNINDTVYVINTEYKDHGPFICKCKVTNIFNWDSIFGFSYECELIGNDNDVPGNVEICGSMSFAEAELFSNPDELINTLKSNN